MEKQKTRYTGFRIYRSGDKNDWGTYMRSFGPNGDRGYLLIETRSAEDARLRVVKEGGWGGLDVYAKTRGKWQAISRDELRELAKKEREKKAEDIEIQRKITQAVYLNPPRAT